MLKKLVRIEILNCIQNDLGRKLESDTTETKIIFPRLQKNSRNYIDKPANKYITVFEEMNNNKIDEILEKCLFNAKEIVIKLGNN